MAHSSEGDAEIIWFNSIRQLLDIKDDKNLARVMSSLSCLSINAVSTELKDISMLVDFIANIRVKRKYILVQTHPLNTSLLQNKKINFNVMISEVYPGMTNITKGRTVLIKNHNSQGGEVRTTSLCPVLGKMFAEVWQGLCPLILQNPVGKKIPISFIGTQPYIKYAPTIGGSEFLVVKMLAKKYRFLPDFKPERAFDVTKKNGSTYGMVWSVSI